MKKYLEILRLILFILEVVKNVLSGLDDDEETKANILAGNGHNLKRRAGD